jgi:Acyl-CoA thioesterase C-terminal domain/Acyl-CoA thioesterase N-terminal domain
MLAALMARAVEATPAATTMHMTRLTLDMSRPVPMGPTRVETTILRDGRRLQALDITLFVEDDPCARGNAVRIRTAPSTIEEEHFPAPWADDLTQAHPDDASLPSPMGGDALWRAHDARWQDDTPGAGCVWLRPHHPLIEGEAMSPTLRAALVADLIMTGGGRVSMDEYLVINPDLTLYLERPPAGEWILLESRVRVESSGAGVSEGTLSDERGRIGRAMKSLLIDRRKR